MCKKNNIEPSLDIFRLSPVTLLGNFRFCEQKGVGITKEMLMISDKRILNGFINKNNYQIKQLDIQSIIEILNPDLLNKKMRLPNGIEISAVQYIQEYVYPWLPENGIIILSNCEPVSIKYFIENNIINECQAKYNGDFPRYVAENTRNNLGKVLLEKDGKSMEITSKNITKYINLSLLERQIKLPNSSEISAKEYIEEFYAQHIPANGYVTLSDGTIISVIKYIEEVLLTNTGIDINRILYNTTRNNTGILNNDFIAIQEAINKLRNPIELKYQNMENEDKRI